MMRGRSLVTLFSTSLVPFVIACEADSTGPGGNESPVDDIMLRITSINVVHDCDPNVDNPGDFQAWVEVWQDTNPLEAVAEYQQVIASAKRSVAINSGSLRNMGNDVRVDATVVRAENRPVSVRVFVQELDGSVVDELISQSRTLRWSAAADCWMDAVCTGPAGSGPYTKSWTREEEFRDDVFDLFNPDDEGCHFAVSYTAVITEQ